MVFLNILFHTIELLSAIIGTYFIKKRLTNNETIYFVYFLWLTVFVETIGMLPRLIYSYDFFNFFDYKLFYSNQWLYNIYTIICFSIYIIYFRASIIKRILRNMLSFLLFIYVSISITYFVVTKSLFEVFSIFIFILGVILLLISILLYFYEILNNDVIFKITQNLPIYIALGALVFHLCVTPIFIYDNYYIKSRPRFVEIHSIIRKICIVFMYSCYSIGFLVCLKNNVIRKK